MPSIQTKIRLCILGNAITVLLAIVPVCILDTGGDYFRIGPADDFILISVKIDNYAKYAGLLIFVAVMNIVKVVSEEIGGPILGFNIYNPDKKEISEFTKNELQLYGNAMFALSGVRQIFTTMITITQFDIALWSLFVCEFASLFTIRMLLNEKRFIATQTDETTELTNITIDQ